MPDSPAPQHYATVTPYLTVPGVARLIDFLKGAFGAVERMRMARPDGTIMHAEVTIGDSIVMLGEPTAEFGPTPGTLFLTVDDCDTTYHRALACGATAVTPPTDQPQAGHRYGGVKDPSGNLWWPASPLKPK